MNKLEELAQGLNSCANKTESTFTNFQDALNMWMNNSQEHLESLSSNNANIHQQNVTLNSTTADFLAAKFGLLLKSQPTINPRRPLSVQQSSSSSVCANDSSHDSATSSDNGRIFENSRPSHTSNEFGPSPIFPRRTIDTEGQKFIAKLIPL